jgi:EpsI family protein
MSSFNANRYTPALVLGLGCAFIFGIREQHKMPPRMPMTTIPMPSPGYGKITDVTVPEEERKVAGMSDYVMRAFQKDSLDAGYSVYVGYYDYQVQGKSIHSPRNCLPGAGWEQVESDVRMVNVDGASHPVNRYVLANEGQHAMVYYWYQGRGRVEASEYRVKWNLLRDAAFSGRTEEALVRIVIPLEARRIRGNDAKDAKAAYAAADSLAMAKAAELIPAVSRALPVPPSESAS